MVFIVGLVTQADKHLMNKIKEADHFKNISSLIFRFRAYEDKTQGKVTVMPFKVFPR